MAFAQFLTGLFDAMVKAATPLLLAALGEIISERAGMLNLGLPGIMSVGALTGFIVAVVMGNPYAGLVVAVLAGILLAALFGFFTITLKSDQVITGIMITLLGTGLTAYFGAEWVKHSISGFPQIAIPVLADLPIIGPALFKNTVLVYLSFLLVPVVWYLLKHTNLGLEIISVGEDPETADTLGVSVERHRYLAVLIGGAFGGAAGAYITLSFVHLWSTGIIAGRGWVAIALVIFATWSAWRALLGAFLFGGIAALQIWAQGIAVTELVPGQALDGVVSVLTHPSIMATYPFIAAIVLMTVISHRGTAKVIGAPEALMEHYVRESE